MASWREVEGEAPELAARAKALFEAHTHLTLATLRRDGSPRISGIEASFEDGEVWMGSMARAVKALDLIRDSRFALHSASEDPPEWPGDAKIAGRAIEVDGGEHHRFRADIEELVVVRLNDARDLLVIESWHPDRGVTRLERA